MPTGRSSRSPPRLRGYGMRPERQPSIRGGDRRKKPCLAVVQRQLPELARARIRCLVSSRNFGAPPVQRLSVESMASVVRLLSRSRGWICLGDRDQKPFKTIRWQRGLMERDGELLIRKRTASQRQAKISRQRAIEENGDQASFRNEARRR